MNWLSGQIILAFGWRRDLMLLVAGLLAGLSVAPFFILPALFVALPIWVWALDGAETRPGWRRLFGPSFRIGFYFGLGYFIVALHWLGTALFVDGGVLVWTMPLAILAVAALMAVFWGWASAVAHWLWSDSGFKLFALATALTLAEFARGHMLTGLPFDLIGYALTANDQMMQAASLVGTYGLTFAAILMAMTPALIWPHDERGLSTRLAPFFGALVVIAAQVGFGQYRLQSTLLTERDDLRLRLIQPNIDQSIKWQADSRDFIVDRLMELSQTRTNPSDTGLDGVTHLIWPEAALPFFLDQYPEALARFARMLPAGTMLITGAPRRDTLGGSAAGDFNSILAFNDTAEVVATYDKQHLVPVGEFLPFKAFFSALGLRQFVPGLEGWTHGTTPRLMQPEGSPAFLPLICYEAIFPGDLGPHVDEAEFILNVTNDGWFDGSIGPAQHFHHARLRAVESGLPMVRVANSGITAMIDPLGRITGRIAEGEVGLLDTSVPARLAPTFFDRWHDLPLYLALVIAVALALFGRWRSARRKPVT